MRIWGYAALIVAMAIAGVAHAAESDLYCLNTGAGPPSFVPCSAANPLATGGGGASNPLPPGTNTIGKVGVDQSNPGVSNGVQPIPGSSGGLLIKRVIVAASITSVAIDAAPGQLYGIEAYNNGTVIGYVKLYNAAQGSVTCGSAGAPIYEGMVPAPSAGGGGYVAMNTMGAGPFSTAITACFTGGIADTDTTVPAANTYLLDFYYK